MVMLTSGMVACGGVTGRLSFLGALVSYGALSGGRSSNNEVYAWVGLTWGSSGCGDVAGAASGASLGTSATEFCSALDVSRLIRLEVRRGKAVATLRLSLLEGAGSSFLRSGVGVSSASSMPSSAAFLVGPTRLECNSMWAVKPESFHCSVDVVSKMVSWLVKRAVT